MSKVEELQAEDWQESVLNSKEPVVVDFWHNMCSWCLKLSPVFEQLPDKIENVRFAKMNLLEKEENRMVALEYGVMSTPTMKVFCQGTPIGEVIGFRPLLNLVEEIEEILSKSDECLTQSTPLEG
jgi:thioredoxin 1